MKRFLVLTLVLCGLVATAFAFAPSSTAAKADCCCGDECAVVCGEACNCACGGDCTGCEDCSKCDCSGAAGCDQAKAESCCKS